MFERILLMQDTAERQKHRAGNKTDEGDECWKEVPLEQAAANEGAPHQNEPGP